MISIVWVPRRFRPCSRTTSEASPRYPPAALGRGRTGAVAGAGAGPHRAPGDGADREHVASLWEVAIKSGLGRTDFDVDPRLLRRGLLENGYVELDVTGAHAAAVDLLPPIHKDPFDRILIAQARIEGIMLLTADEVVARYPGPIRAV